MKKLNDLKSEIESLFKESGLNENIEFRISNVEEYDLQINNLVKHQRSENIDFISLELKQILDSNDQPLMLILFCLYFNFFLLAMFIISLTKAGEIFFFF